MSGLSKIAKKTLPDLFCQHIHELIRQGSLRYGDRLPPQTQLAEDMGVSLTSVKRGTEKLQEQGLVEVRQGQGVFVAALPLEQQLFEIRMAVECAAAASAARRATHKDLQSLQDHFDNLVANLRAGEVCLPYDFGFHRAIWQASHNGLQARLMELIDENMKQGMRQSLVRIKHDCELIESAVDVHGRILSAIKRGDERDATDSMRAHLLFAAQGGRSPLAAAVEMPAG